MKKYSHWVLRYNEKSSPIESGYVLNAIKHLIKCTSVRRHFCGNPEKWVLVREPDSDVLSRPVFKIFTATHQFRGIIYPLVLGEEADTSVLEQYVDAIDTSLNDEILAHIQSAVTRCNKLGNTGTNEEQAANTSKKEETENKKLKPRKKDSNPKNEKIEIVGPTAQNLQTTVISLIGDYQSMLPLVTQVATVIRGSPVQMTVVNSIS